MKPTSTRVLLRTVHIRLHRRILTSKVVMVMAHHHLEQLEELACSRTWLLKKTASTLPSVPSVWRSSKRVCPWHDLNVSAVFTDPVSQLGLSITQAAVPFINMTASDTDIQHAWWCSSTSQGSVALVRHDVCGLNGVMRRGRTRFGIGQESCCSIMLVQFRIMRSR